MPVSLHLCVFVCFSLCVCLCLCLSLPPDTQPVTAMAPYANLDAAFGMCRGSTIAQRIQPQ
jgi:hypothetical protein